MLLFGACGADGALGPRQAVLGLARGTTELWVVTERENSAPSGRGWGSGGAFPRPWGRSSPAALSPRRPVPRPFSAVPGEARPAPSGREGRPRAPPSAARRGSAAGAAPRAAVLAGCFSPPVYRRPRLRLGPAALLPPPPLGGAVSAGRRRRFLAASRALVTSCAT